MRAVLNGVVVAAGLALAAPVQASVLIDFDGLAVGTVLSNQFAGIGVTFSPNALSGPGGPTTTWATNTNLTVVSATGPDVGGLGTPPLVSGNMVRSFNGWLIENGDPSLRISFAADVSSVSLDFAGIANSANTQIIAYALDGITMLANAVAAAPGQQTLTVNASGIRSLIVRPGDFGDWVGFDNLAFTPETSRVPEPASLALLGAGLLGLGLLRRRAA